MKRIALTGGLGFIGTNLVPRLRDEFGADIRILDNLSNPSGDLEIGDGIELLEGDIRDRAAVDRLVGGADAVIHLAAHTRVVESVEDPVGNYEINVQGTFNVLEAMRQSGCGTIVYASTGGAILGEVPPPIHEEIAAKPASPYGASKLMGEGYCWAYAQSYGFHALSLRFSNIYGPHCRRKDSVVAAFIKQIVKSGKVTVYGDGEQVRDYLFVGDLVGGIISAIKSQRQGVYQLGSGRPTSVNELIGILKESIPRPFTVQYADPRAGEIRRTYCDITKAARDLDFRPKVPLRDGVRQTWEWFQDSSLV